MSKYPTSVNFLSISSKTSTLSGSGAWEPFSQRSLRLPLAPDSGAVFRLLVPSRFLRALLLGLGPEALEAFALGLHLEALEALGPRALEGLQWVLGSESVAALPLGLASEAFEALGPRALAGLVLGSEAFEALPSGLA